jgi:ketosteroid isomerase-like protein
MDALTTARRYRDAWTAGAHAAARALLAPDLQVEVPINAYDGPDDFMAAVERFGAGARRVDLLAEAGTEEDAFLLYDMDVDGLGVLRVVEHFTVAAGRIVRLRQIHDTAPLRSAAGR